MWRAPADPPGGWGVFASRAVNRFLLWGRWECVCSRAWRRGWVLFVLTVDPLFERGRGEVDHCRRLAEWEAARDLQ